eukprot:TRINITY_DN2302_c1_g1_i1.p1 TRINITY_DN2302_c1_g1~~TRINITY_DN2302_c1_g1_i1.p1  ORF type:complete len:351 (+),score=85.01 TRINITY_DN2302_c1_g1_i1:37-1089(+)
MHPQLPPGAPCPAFEKLKFCSYGLDCQYAHNDAPKRCINELMHELIQMGLSHIKGIYKCSVCSYQGANGFGPEEAVAKVGETESYRYCVKCGNFYFYPHVQVIILRLMEDAGTDYVEFKKKVDAYHARLPSILQVPFMYEAHRWATSRFAWSLTGPENAKEVLELVFEDSKKECKRMFSMGSGTGYIEHVFVNTSKEMGKELEVHAFDVLKVKDKDKYITFDVTVKEGDVNNLAEYGDMSDAVLLLCWPPFGSQRGEESTMAHDCIKQYAKQGGRQLIYIGDVNATGDWRYHDHLASNWEILPKTFDFKKLNAWVPQQMGLIYAGNDSIGVYRLREKPLELQPRLWHVTA